MANQFFIFIICMLTGIVSGLLYDFFYVIKRLFRSKIVTAALNATFFTAFSVLYVFVAVMFEFPSSRGYMFIGCMLGLLAYVKSFHIIVAFLIEKVYNMRRKKL